MIHMNERVCAYFYEHNDIYDRFFEEKYIPI